MDALCQMFGLAMRRRDRFTASPFSSGPYANLEADAVNRSLIASLPGQVLGNIRDHNAGAGEQ